MYVLLSFGVMLNAQSNLIIINIEPVFKEVKQVLTSAFTVGKRLNAARIIVTNSLKGCLHHLCLPSHILQIVRNKSQ